MMTEDRLDGRGLRQDLPEWIEPFGPISMRAMPVSVLKKVGGEADSLEVKDRNHKELFEKVEVRGLHDGSRAGVHRPDQGWNEVMDSGRDLWS